MAVTAQAVRCGVRCGVCVVCGVILTFGLCLIDTVTRAYAVLRYMYSYCDCIQYSQCMVCSLALYGLILCAFTVILCDAVARKACAKQAEIDKARARTVSMHAQ